MVFDRQTEDIDPDEWLNMPIEEAQIKINNKDFKKFYRTGKVQ
jgi:hypothetical protein